MQFIWKKIKFVLVFLIVFLISICSIFTSNSYAMDAKNDAYNRAAQKYEARLELYR